MFAFIAQVTGNLDGLATRFPVTCAMNANIQLPP